MQRLATLFLKQHRLPWGLKTVYRPHWNRAIISVLTVYRMKGDPPENLFIIFRMKLPGEEGRGNTESLGETFKRGRQEPEERQDKNQTQQTDNEVNQYYFIFLAPEDNADAILHRKPTFWPNGKQ